MKDWSTRYRAHYKDGHIRINKRPNLNANDTRLYLYDKTKYKCDSKRPKPFTWEEGNFEIAKKFNAQLLTPEEIDEWVRQNRM
jgi:hypothetical protein